jgi:TolB-like protein
MGLGTLAALVAMWTLWSGFETEWTSARDTEQVEGPASKAAEPAVRAAIAVLPFSNQSQDATREYFADGLTQDIINALGRFPELTVMSWNAVSPYKGKPARPGEVARRLAVNYQVEGSVIVTGGRVRVIAQLVNAEGRVLWSARFDEGLADLFALQDKITTEVAGALAIRVTNFEQQRVLALPAERLEAYDYVLRARPARQRPTRANNTEARTFLRRAIEIDPNSAAAYAALAETYHVAVAMGWAESPTESLRRAEELASKALSLDDSDVRAHVTLGRIHVFLPMQDASYVGSTSRIPTSARSNTTTPTAITTSSPRSRTRSTRSMLGESRGGDERASSSLSAVGTTPIRASTNRCAASTSRQTSVTRTSSRPRPKSAPR